MPDTDFNKSNIISENKIQELINTHTSHSEVQEILQKGEENPYVKTRFILALFDGIGIHYLSDTENFPLDDVRKMMVNMV